VASIREAVQGLQVANEFGPEGIEVDVTNHLQEIGVFLAEDRLIPVLKEGTESSMTPVVSDGVAGQEPSHEGRKRNRASPQQKVDMIGQQSPGIAGGGGFDEQAAKAIQEMVSVLIILEDPGPFHPAKDDMVQGARCIEASLAGHKGRIANGGDIVKGNVMILWTSLRP
jgi:hypothetical protein